MHRFRGPLSRSKTCFALKCPPASTKLGVRNIHTVKGLPYDVNKGLGEFLPPDALRVVGLEYQKGLLDRLNEEVRGTEMVGKSIVQTIISSSPDRFRALAFNYASLALNNHFFLDQLKPLEPSYASHEHLISSLLERNIRMQHGSLAQLKSAFSAAAMGLFTSGYVWLVTDAAGNMAIIPTYGPGSLLMRSQTYMAHIKGLNMQAAEEELDVGVNMGQWGRGHALPEGDMYFGEWKEDLEKRDQEAKAQESEAQEGSPSTITTPTMRQAPPGTAPASPASAVSSSQPQNPPHTRSLHYTSSVSSADDDNLVARFSAQPSTPTTITSVVSGLISDPPAGSPSASSSSRPKSLSRSQVLTSGETLYPLFCVSVHEHAWMSAGYGIWGKEEWLKKFWDVLDWEKVSKSYRYFRVDTK
ncbi:hypothetical protein DFJ43DRAFT_128147 [Lentinula guzmanii]|uniref:Manganese/iron superoxide dismutase C-terminal domain-containing protein n=1 Tax=Lentinula guzmanii TaxID=2804957 RepID=A0AA38N327_9AGAR|nr:hypothetical protein DFJ43DRAFT_128147 [Lentinula guzmanii]